MRTAAVIVVSGGGVSPFTRLGGLSLLQRAVLTAQKAGAATCYLVLAQDQEALQHELQNDPRVTSQVAWVRLNPGAMAAIEQESFCLVFAVDTIFRYPLVQELSRQAAPGKSVTVADAAGVPLLALTDGSRVSEM